MLASSFDFWNSLSRELSKMMINSMAKLKRVIRTDMRMEMRMGLSD